MKKVFYVENHYKYNGVHNRSTGHLIEAETEEKAKEFVKNNLAKFPIRSQEVRLADERQIENRKKGFGGIIHKP